MVDSIPVFQKLETHTPCQASDKLTIFLTTSSIEPRLRGWAFSLNFTRLDVILSLSIIYIDLVLEIDNYVCFNIHSFCIGDIINFLSIHLLKNYNILLVLNNSTNHLPRTSKEINIPLIPIYNLEHILLQNNT